MVLSCLRGTVPLTLLERVRDGGELRKLDRERVNHPLKVSKEGPEAECSVDTLLPVLQSALVPCFRGDTSWEDWCRLLSKNR